MGAAGEYDPAPVKLASRRSGGERRRPEKCGGASPTGAPRLKSRTYWPVLVAALFSVVAFIVVLAEAFIALLSAEAAAVLSAGAAGLEQAASESAARAARAT